MSDSYVLAIDAGTTGVRCRAVHADGRPSVSSYREFTQHFPEPGRVEHDAAEIWNAVRITFAEVVASQGTPAAIGITNQRETVVAWNRSTGEVHGRAIVWQDRRTADLCERLTNAGALETVRSLSGLVLDPYFSGTKIAWMLANGVPRHPDVVFGTIDSWILWNLTGGEVLATDPSNASRTMLFDIRSLRWSDTLGDLLGVPIANLPEVRPSSGRLGVTRAEGLPSGVPVSGIAGDQQAALFGQACFRPGMAKNTYGTGSFVLMNIGDRCPDPSPGLLTTVAWSIADSHGTVETSYALEGSFNGCATVWGSSARRRRSGRWHRPSSTVAEFSSFRPSPVSEAHGGTRTLAEASSASRAARLVRTSPVPWSRPWRCKPVTRSGRWSRRADDASRIFASTAGPR
jgi:glycerol kinase